MTWDLSNGLLFLSYLLHMDWCIQKLEYCTIFPAVKFMLSTKVNWSKCCCLMVSLWWGWAVKMFLGGMNKEHWEYMPRIYNEPRHEITTSRHQQYERMLEVVVTWFHIAQEKTIVNNPLYNKTTLTNKINWWWCSAGFWTSQAGGHSMCYQEELRMAQ